MNTMLGALACACSKRSRTRAAPTPTNISMKAGPLRLKDGTLASPATALARSVLPVPGEPTSRTPFGIFPPRRRYRSGRLRKSTIAARLVDTRHVVEGDAGAVLDVDLGP